jgi:outer membrane receptor protein involved in Fe transport
MAAVALATVLVCASPAVAQAPKYKIDIPAENAAKALNDFARQTDIQIIFPYEVAEKSQVAALKGEFTREEALAVILRETGLEVGNQSDKTISLRATVKRPLTPEAGLDDVVEVVVTGTHIRGANPTSPVHTVTRKEIEQSGYSQIGDVLRSLPENFSGGQNPGVLSANSTNSANLNATNASTANLRGLGSDATLVLVNGHRLASDYAFQGVDLSGVPLSAVQRIEIVPDGASALYGSDAVAGVVNIILRKNFVGGEVSARLAGATQGGGFEQTYSLMQGWASDNVYFLANYEYSKQGAMYARDREFTAAAGPETTLQQPMIRNSAFFSLGRTFSERFAVSADLLISDRETSSVSQSGVTTIPNTTDGYTPAYAANVTAEIELSDNWNLRLTGGTAGSRNSLGTTYFGTRYPNYLRNGVDYVEAAADGPLFHLPSGEVKTAIGGGVRKERFQQGFGGNASTLTPTRRVTYAFFEGLVPLVSPSSERVGLNELELNLSVRSERYSDFGTTTNPKVGIRYVPIEDLALRATWGKSFKAPSFYQMYQTYAATLFRASLLGYTGPLANGTALLASGGNKNLRPEKSTSWTVGADYTPASVPGMTLSATAFRIEYTDRVVEPISPPTKALSSSLFTPFVRLSPSVGELDTVLAQADFFDNYTGVPYDPANVVAIAYNNLTNATAQTADGVDLGYRQSFEIGAGQMAATLNATWLTLKQQTIPTVASRELSGTVFNAPDFKARGSVTWTEGGWSATLTANYINGFTDTGLATPQPIGSWTTMDAAISYRFGATAGPLADLKLALTASNLLDRDPPRVASVGLLYTGLDHDTTNSSVMGRFVGLTLTKGW